MARKTVAELNALLDEKVARILALEAQLAELRAQPAAPGARVTERGALYHIRHYGRFFKVAVARSVDVRAALDEFKAAHPQYAAKTISVERFDA
jgi:uncharacterized protein involved in exopolysaccharide biosynthesis